MDWGNIILGTIGVVAAPFTGGASLSLTGAAIRAHQAKSAADKQSAAADQAISVMGPLHQGQINRLNQFITPGQNSAQRLGFLMGQPQAPTQTGPTGGANGGSPVQMRAPDGSMQLVPAALVAHYQQKGATIVGGGQGGPGGGVTAEQDQSVRAWLQAHGLPQPQPSGGQ